MSFKSKTDNYGIADSSTIVVISEEEGRSVQEVTAQGEDGSVIASEVFGANATPSNEYTVKGDVSWAAGAKKLGAVTTFGTSDKVKLLNLTITVGAGAAPTISASGEMVESGATTGCTYSIPATTLSSKHHAQILWSAFTLSGAGCHLTGATYTAECSLTKATKEGVCLASDVSAGKLTASLTIRQTDSTPPTITTTSGSGWEVTGALTCSNPDSDYPTWTATLTKYLTKDAAPVVGD